jgi:ADP-ribose pyrophosphatase
MPSPIPPKAKKVFSGVIFDTYQWEQEMYDGSTETFERLRRADTINIIAVQGKDIFITKQEQPTRQPSFSFIGGRMDPGESALETAKRELLEESGMTAESFKLYETIQPANKIDWKIHTFIAKGCTKIQDQMLDPGEKIEILKISLDELLTMAIDEQLREKGFTHKALRMKLFPEELEKFKTLLFS